MLLLGAAPEVQAGGKWKELLDLCGVKVGGMYVRDAKAMRLVPAPAGTARRSAARASRNPAEYVDERLQRKSLPLLSLHTGVRLHMEMRLATPNFPGSLVQKNGESKVK